MILVVDDQDDNLNILCRMLQKKGYHTDAATNGNEALSKIKENSYQLILLDIMMPGLDGLDVLKEIRQNFSKSDLPVIMVTAKDDATSIHEALEHQANDYLTKPYDFKVLFLKVMKQFLVKNSSNPEGSN